MRLNKILVQQMHADNYIPWFKNPNSNHTSWIPELHFATQHNNGDFTVELGVKADNRILTVFADKNKHPNTSDLKLIGYITTELDCTIEEYTKTQNYNSGHKLK